MELRIEVQVLLQRLDALLIAVSDNDFEIRKTLPLQYLCTYKSDEARLTCTKLDDSLLRISADLYLSISLFFKVLLLLDKVVCKDFLAGPLAHIPRIIAWSVY